MSTIMLVPKINPNDDSMLISEWLVEENDYVKSGQDIVRVETSKVDITLSSDHSGFICRHSMKGNYVKVNEKLASFSLTPNNENKKQQLDTEEEHLNSYQLSASAVKYVTDNNIDISHYDLRGLITLKDIQQLNTGINPEFTTLTIENISATKQQEIKILERSYHNALTSSVTVQFESVTVRKKLNEFPWLNNQILPYVLFHFAKLCMKHPKFTAYYCENQIFYYNQVNVGLAIDIHKGLKIVVIRNAQALSLQDMHIQVIDHISNYYNSELNLDAVTSSTITVTDLSSRGILSFQPLLNDKQSAILAIGGDSEMNGYPMTLTLVFDHRVLTGQEAAEFLVKLKKAILGGIL